MFMSKKKKIVLISICIALFILLGAVYFVQSKKKDVPDQGKKESSEKMATGDVPDSSPANADSITEEQTAESKPVELYQVLPEVVDDGMNRYTLKWDNQLAGKKHDKKEAEYVVNRRMKTLDGEMSEWEVVEISETEMESFSTGRLAPFCTYEFRIDINSGSEIIEGEVISIETEESPLYATVWTTRDMVLFKNPTGDEQIGTIPVLTSLSVLGEENGRFLVQRGPDGDEGYIDTNYCMINLTEYIGDLCRYDITNSYSSIYCAYNYPIPGITGTVIKGYEDILLDDDTFVVPLLYPTAKKLITGAKSARDGGYVIKINDSFRPYVATRYIYDETTKCMDYVTPGYEYTRVSLSDYRTGASTGTIGLSGLTKYEPVVEYASEGDTVGYEVVDPNVVTYKTAMLSDSYNLGAFLAAKGSSHNLGIAMDMTLESIDGTELQMQSHMHDLSYHSVQGANNSNANLLKNYMTPAGFGMINSEWWHFQDNDSKSQLRPSSVSDGVSIEGWKKDDKGWRYRLNSGEYYKDKTETIDGKSIRFDKEGYMIDD